MKRLVWALSCLALATLQIQATFALGPSVSAAYTGFNLSSDSYSTSQTTNTAQIEINIPDSNNPVRIDTNQPALALNNAASQAGFVTQNNYFNLASGNILISPEKDVVIGTQEGIVSIASGATIFMMESGNDTVIYDLYQARPKQVSVVVNNHKLVMEPGCMIVLTKQKTKNFEDLAVNCHSISYRRAQEIDLQENTVNAFVANFSIFSALVRIQPLKELVDSKDKRDQLLLHKLLKSAAMLRT